MSFNRESLYKLVEGQVRNKLHKKITESKMKRNNTIRLTESQLHGIVKESVRRLVTEISRDYLKDIVLHGSDGIELLKLARMLFGKKGGDWVNRMIGAKKSPEEIADQLERMLRMGLDKGTINDMDVKRIISDYQKA